MSLTTFDFTVLGDTQPEGLLVASALARRGYSVQVVSSAALGEKNGFEEDDWIFPSSLGTRQLSDILFKAGFFRYEDAALIPHQKSRQLLLPKNRLTFTGAISNCLSEVEREFPHLWSSLASLYQLKEERHKAALNKTLQKLMDIQKRDSQVRDLVILDAHWTLRPQTELSDYERLRHWVEGLLRQSEKHFRVDPQLGKPYCGFLAEHARKWGVVFNSQNLDFKSLLVGYQVTPEARSSSLIINSLGGHRLLARSGQISQSSVIDYWLFEDQITMDLESVPEPFGDHLYFYAYRGIEQLPRTKSLTIERDQTKGVARIKLGSWLPFDDTKLWLAQIEEARRSLKTLFPFVSESVFMPLPTILDLTEFRGEIIKRGQFDRLVPKSAPEKGWKKWVKDRWTRMPIHSSLNSLTLKRKVYSLNPYNLAWRTRDYSFEKSLALLDHFERKKRSYGKV